MSTWYSWFGLFLGLSIILYIVRDFFMHRKAQNRVNDLLDLESRVEESFSDAEDRSKVLEMYESDPELEANEESCSKTEEKERAADDIISVSVIARDDIGFSGARVMEEMTAANLYHGKFNAFHRFENTDGTGDILFSIVSVKEPGVFDLKDMGEQNFEGLTLFFRVSKFGKSMDTLDLLIKTAKQLSFRLNGELVDYQHKPMNKATLESYKEKIKKIV